MKSLQLQFIREKNIFRYCTKFAHSDKRVSNCTVTKIKKVIANL